LPVLSCCVPPDCWFCAFCKCASKDESLSCWPLRRAGAPLLVAADGLAAWTAGNGLALMPHHSCRWKYPCPQQNPSQGGNGRSWQANLATAVLHALVDFRLLQAIFTLPLLRAKALNHGIQRVFARMRVQPAFASRVDLALQTLDQSALLDDRLIDAFDKLLTVQQRAHRQATVAEAVVASIALKLFPLLLGARQFLLMFGQALQGVFLSALGLVYGRLQTI
jgi:hypothetical protein